MGEIRRSKFKRINIKYMKIEIDEKKILTEVMEVDGSVHSKIKEEIKKKLIDKFSNQIEREFIDSKWDGREEIKRQILEDLEEKQSVMVKDILKKFYDSYRHKKSDLAILKELKKLIGED